MGAGSSARKTSDMSVAIVGPQDGKKYRVPGADKGQQGGQFPEDRPSQQQHGSQVVQHASSSNSKEGGPLIRPCDSCGETRKTAKCGGQGFLCLICQMDSGAPPKPLRLDNAPTQGPQPLRRSASTDLQAPPVQRRQRRLRTTSCYDDTTASENRSEEPTSPSSPSPSPSQGRRSRLPTKDRLPPTVAAGAAIVGVPSPTNSNISSSNGVAQYDSQVGSVGGKNTLTVVGDRQDFRSIKGLNELRASLARSRSTSSLEEMPHGPFRREGLESAESSDSEEEQAFRLSLWKSSDLGLSN